MTKISFPHAEDYIEILAGIREVTGKKIPFLSRHIGPTVSLARYDVNIVSSLASQVDSGTSLTDRQSELALKLIEKYRKQFYNLGIDVVPFLSNVKFRIPIRIVDRTKRAYIDDKQIILKFPYDKTMVPEVTKAAKESCGRFMFDIDNKIWKLSLTEYNLNWTSAFCSRYQFEIDAEIDRLMQLIIDCEKTNFKIELVVDGDNNIVINNAEPSMLDYVQENIGEISYSNLIKLVDYSNILGYTVNTDIKEAIGKGFDPIIAGLIDNKESHIARTEPTASDGEIFKQLVRYAELTDRFPIYIYEPDLSNRLLNCAREIFPDRDILSVAKLKADQEVDFTDIKCVYFNKLKRGWAHRIPILVSTNAMLFGAEKQAVVQSAEKVVYYTPTVYNKEAKEIGGTTNNQG